MALSINTNVASLTAQRNLMGSQSTMQTAMQRLSSGLRINSGKDDAAGLYQAELMTADIRGMNQAIRNANDGISLGQTADGALGQISNNLHRIREIAVQAANSTTQDRTGLQKEVDQLTQEISRIVSTTEFSGTSLLSASGNLTFQVGASGAASNQVTVGTVDMTTLSSYSGTLTATGTIDVSSSAAASGALASLDGDIKSVAQERATFGAVQNRFEAVIANLSNYSENLSAARGRIMDADFAAETATMTKSQVLQQAGVAMLSQANQLSQNVLQLLR